MPRSKDAAGYDDASRFEGSGLDQGRKLVRGKPSRCRIEANEHLKAGNNSSCSGLLPARSAPPHLSPNIAKSSATTADRIWRFDEPGVVASRIRRRRNTREPFSHRSCLSPPRESLMLRTMKLSALRLLKNSGPSLVSATAAGVVSGLLILCYHAFP